MRTYEAIADPVRREILDLLRERELSAGRIASHFSVSRPAVSRHLRVLRDARLVRAQQRGRLVVYRLDAAPLGEVDAWLRRYERFWTEGLSSLKRYLEEEAVTAESSSSREQGRRPRGTGGSG